MAGKAIRLIPSTHRRLALAPALLAAACLMWAPDAGAATINVTTTADELNNDGNCSLREAIVSANTDTARDACTKGSGADTINVPTGSHDFSAALAGTDDNGLQGDLDIRTPMTIRGAGAVTTSVDAKGLDRVFDVVQNVSVTISRMTVRGGAQPAAFGGGIRNAGKLTLSGDIITDNSGFHGAGVDSSGSTLNIQGSAISNNPSGNLGGGLAVEDGQATITGSVIAGNSAGEGGGIDVRPDGSLVARQSSIEGNTLNGGDGGGIFSRGVITLTDLRVSRNVAGFGAGIESDPDAGGGATLTRVLVSGNTAGSQGGGIRVIGPMTLTQSTVFANTAGSTAGGGSGIGGGISNSGTLTMTRSTIAGNNTKTGDGLFNDSTATLTNVTVAGNGESSAQGQGGGIYNDGQLSLVNATLAANEASFFAGDGGNLYNNNATSGSVTSKDTITADPQTSGNCNDTNKPQSLGNNLSFASPGSGGDTHPCFSSGGGNVLSDPKLGPLQDNGGPTKTEALGTGSAALNAGANCATNDQRGVPRPQGPRCDIGAYEVARCMGAVVNRVGTPGADRFIGGSVPDVWLGLGGNDVFDGGGGGDSACGGSGKDRLTGGRGGDKLSGGGGDDQLFSRGDGAKDTDACGAGRHDAVTADPTDTLTGCEIVR